MEVIDVQFLQYEFFFQNLWIFFWLRRLLVCFLVRRLFGIGVVSFFVVVGCVVFMEQILWVRVVFFFSRVLQNEEKDVMYQVWQGLGFFVIEILLEVELSRCFFTVVKIFFCVLFFNFYVKFLRGVCLYFYFTFGEVKVRMNVWVGGLRAGRV